MSEEFPDVDALRQAFPDGVIERVAVMSALAWRAVLAYLDRDAQSLAAVIERVGTWDDYPRKYPFPAAAPRFKNAVTAAMNSGITILRAAADSGKEPGAAQLQAAAAKLVAELAPAEHQQSALRILQLDQQAADDERWDEQFTAGGLAAYAALTAAVYGDPAIMPTQHEVRRAIVKYVRQDEADAYKVPLAERITEVDEQEARAFLDGLFEPGSPLQESDRPPTLYELDILALVQRHLLHTKADATTLEQAAELRRCILVIVKSSLEAFDARRPYASPSGSFPGGPRVQPKRKKPKSKRS